MQLKNGLTDEQRATALRMHRAGSGITPIIRTLGKSYDCVARFLKEAVGYSPSRARVKIGEFSAPKIETLRTLASVAPATRSLRNASGFVAQRRHGKR